MAEKKLWGGRFHEGTAASVEAYTESVSYDSALYRQDIAGSQAHARMLARQGVLTPAEADQLTAGLDAVRAEIESGVFQWKRELEDVHMNIRAPPQRSGGPGFLTVRGRPRGRMAKSCDQDGGRLCGQGRGTP